MNDFTKEELEWLSHELHIIIHNYENTHRMSMAIAAKVKSMIDNYCEHDWRKGVHLFNDVYCTKCKLHFEVNNEV